jgi:hypothetical protein
VKTIATELARLVTTTRELPTLALERAKMSLASTVASADGARVVWRYYWRDSFYCAR